MEATTWSPDCRVSKTALMAAIPTKRNFDEWSFADLLPSSPQKQWSDKRDFVTFWGFHLLVVRKIRVFSFLRRNFLEWQARVGAKSVLTTWHYWLDVHNASGMLLVNNEIFFLDQVQIWGVVQQWRSKGKIAGILRSVLSISEVVRKWRVVPPPTEDRHVKLFRLIFSNTLSFGHVTFLYYWHWQKDIWAPIIRRACAISA